MKEQSVESLAVHCDDLKDSENLTLTTKCSPRMFQFYENLKSPGVKLTELQTTSLQNTSINFVQFLHEITSEQQFEVTYI